MMSEQQFALDKLYYSIMTPIEKISVGRNYITYGEVVDLLNEQQATIQSLKEENERLKEKLNVTALELVDEAISMGKAVEISEMDYHEFLEYRKKKGKAMELQR